MRRRLLSGLIVTVGVAFLLGFMASRGIMGSHGWAVALIVGAAIWRGHLARPSAWRSRR